MKRKILWYLMAVFLCLTIYAFSCNNEFADIVGMFSGFLGLICFCAWWFKNIGRKIIMRNSVLKLKTDNDAMKTILSLHLNAYDDLETEKKLAVSNGIGWLKQYNETVIERDIALEQRTADWDRIKQLEQQLQELKTEILTLKSRSDG